MSRGGVKKRDTILQVAEKAFAEYGFNGVGMRDIAARAGLHSATLYHYFPGKEELFFAVVERTFREANRWIQQSLSLSLSGRDRLVLFIEKQFEFLATHQNYLRILLQEIQCSSSRVERIAERFVRPMLSNLMSLLDEMAREGILRSGDVRQVLFQILSVNAGQIIFAPLLKHIAEPGGPVEPAGLLESRKRAIVELLLNGLAAEPEESGKGRGRGT